METLEGGSLTTACSDPAFLRLKGQSLSNGRAGAAALGGERPEGVSLIARAGPQDAAGHLLRALVLALHQRQGLQVLQSETDCD